jgi:hypothetical protein
VLQQPVATSSAPYNIIPDKTTSKILIARVAPGIARFALSLPEAGVHLPDQKHTRNIFERF